MIGTLVVKRLKQTTLFSDTSKIRAAIIELVFIDYLHVRISFSKNILFQFEDIIENKN